MSKIIKIQIIHALAKQSAKNETYQKGVIDKAVDQKLIAAAYHEQAGNEAYHEAMLGRYLFSQIERLKTYFADYLTGEGNLANDATIDSMETNGVTEILLSVSDRFNTGYVKTLARLSQKYVEDRMIHLWWAPVSKDFAALYAGLAEDDLDGIRHCFHKTEPAAPHYNFPTAINLRYPIIPNRDGIPGLLTPTINPAGSPAGTVIPVETLFSNPYLLGRGETSEISYTLTGENDKKPFDDIIIRCDNPACCSAAIGPNGQWNIRGISTGITIVTLFSRHNDQVYAKFAVRVVP